MFNKRRGTNSRQFAAIGGTIASTVFGVVGATAVGFLAIFNDELADVIQSIDLSNSPLSGVQSLLANALQGIHQLTVINKNC